MNWLVPAFHAVFAGLALVVGPDVAPFVVEWDTEPRMPEYGFGGSARPENDPLERLINYGQGVIVVLGVIGIFYAAVKMITAKMGRPDEAAEGITNLIWAIMGVCMMLVAIPVVTTLVGVG